MAGKAGIIASLVHTVFSSSAPIEPVSHDSHHHMAGVINSFSDPDSIRSVDPDPGGQKLPTKIEKVKKFQVLKCWMFSFEG